MSQSTTICLMHGHGVDASIWDDVNADLASSGPVVRPDFSRLTHTTIEAYADELAAQLQVVESEKVALVGHSMGGYIALAFAERYPERVRGLVLYHSTAYADDETKAAQRTKAIGALTSDGTPKFIGELMPKLVAPTFPEERVQTLIDRFSSLPAEALIAGVRAIAGRPDRTDALRNARFPVLVVLGKEDQVIPFETARQMADLSDRVEVVGLDDVGHLSMVEQPALSVRILRAFADSL